MTTALVPSINISCRGWNEKSDSARHVCSLSGRASSIVLQSSNSLGDPDTRLVRYHDETFRG